MHEIELLLLALMVAVAGLSILARLVRVPYPILLVLGGLVIGFVPAMPAVELPPELVLVAFLPPLLYWSGFFSSPRDLRADARAITLAAVGLVLATAGAVAVVAHAKVDGLSWPAAFALGAIVSPTDPLAATAIARRLGVPRRLITVLEGESLVNDATALVAYRVAVAAAVSGSFVIWQAGLRFLVGATGGVLVGLLVGWLIAEVRRRLDDPVVEIVISVVTGYVAYLPAELLGVSGVLAAVTAGLYVGWRAPELASPSTRLLGFSFWEVMVYLANAVLFILVGLQLRPILSGLGGTAVAVLVGQAALISAVVIAVRLGWVFTVPYLVRLLDRRQGQRLRRAGARERLVIGWSGMRGAVSLAAALALPEDFPGADPAQPDPAAAGHRRRGRGAGGAAGPHGRHQSRPGAPGRAGRRGLDPRRHRGPAARPVRVPPPASQGARRHLGGRRRRGPLPGLPAPGPRAAAGPAPGHRPAPQPGDDQQRRHAPDRARARPGGHPAGDLAPLRYARFRTGIPRLHRFPTAG
ncbi:MAG: nha [Actinomycetia bacterium]|nr:nha [Actinomycetes bacterium]